MTSALMSRTLDRTGCRTFLGRAFPWSGVLVLNYHRVGDSAGSAFDRGLWSATADQFAEQVRFCKSHFDVISPAELPDVLSRGRNRYVLLTFDDGYRDNYDVAFPILAAEGIPATFFVTTGFVDTPRVPWWDEIAWMVRASGKSAARLDGWLPATVRFEEPDRELAVRTLLRAYKSMPGEMTSAYLDAIGEATGSGRLDPAPSGDLWMTWNMLREMKARGMTIGGHTANHPVLAQASRETQRREIGECGHRLATELGEPMRFFSYPVGGPEAFDEITRQCLREAGVQYAFSYYDGYRRYADWDDYDIRRVRMEVDLTPDRFRSIVDLPQWFA